MSIDAKRLLQRLLEAGEKAHAGARKRAARLTRTHLEPYWRSRDVSERESFEGWMRAAEHAGAVRLTHQDGLPEELIVAVDLVSLERLAQFVGDHTRSALLEQAGTLLAPWRAAYPVLDDVLERWRLLKQVRKTGPQQADQWVTAAQLIKAMARESASRIAELPVREVSARLFRDSKRIEGITAVLDVLLTGDVSAAPREPRAVWAEIGLRKEEQPARLAGRVCVVRERVSALLDVPYGAFPPSTVLGVSGRVDYVLTIENLTTFHSEAAARCEEPALILFTAGMPSPAWRAMYERLIASVPPHTELRHWGDIDEGGFRIAACLARSAAAQGRKLQPYRMSPSDLPQGHGRVAGVQTLTRMRHYATEAGWADLGAAVERAGRVVEQEELERAS